jgi:hypothetical protein
VKAGAGEELVSKPFSSVLDAELRSFTNTHSTAERSSSEVIRAAHEERLVGLAFSGGGIRSATFNLGVLQALADLQLLRKFHYLSTVSGGGYIGSWFIAWIHRRDRAIDGVASALRTAWKQHPGGDAPEEICFLRRFSNYLTPKLGWLGADTWTVIAIYLRNVLLNMTGVIAGFAMLLLLPRLLGWLMSYLPSSGGGFLFVLLASVILLVFAGFFIHRNIEFFDLDQQKMWTADPLSAGDNSVIKAEEHGIETTGGLQVWFSQHSQQTFNDFVLGFDFVMSSSEAEADVFVRCKSLSAASQSLPSECLAIHVGGEQRTDADPTCTTGGLVGRQPATGARLNPPPPGEPNRMMIICRGETCTVRLNGRVVNVFRAKTDIPLTGHIGAIANSRSGSVNFSNIRLRPLASTGRRRLSQGWVQLLIVIPLFLAALLTVRILPLTFSRPPQNWLFLLCQSYPWLCWGAFAGIVTLILEVIGAAKNRATDSGISKRALINVFAITAGAAVGGLALQWFHELLPPLRDISTGEDLNFWPRLVWMPPAFIVALSIMLIIYIGLLGRGVDRADPNQSDPNEAIREWWSRLGAWLLIYTLVWIGFFGIALYSPPVLGWLAAKARITLSALGVGWVVTTLSSLIAAKNPATGRGGKSIWLESLAAIGPYTFIIGLFAILSWGVDMTLRPSAREPVAHANSPSGLTMGVTVTAGSNQPVSVQVTPKPVVTTGLSDQLRKHWHALDVSHQRIGGNSMSRNGRLLLILGMALIIVVILSLRVDINEFSMHSMYRNRLARCYLGASNVELRRQHPFTGFDPNDDILLGRLDQYHWDKEQTGPYPIINCSINLVGGGELAWQERKAASFVFTPKYCGYDFPELPPGYCATGNVNDQSRIGYAASRGPVTLATAMAISGAAVSPNMGYHTSPAAAFLMTLFNVRLGWWIGNPRSKNGWKNSSPNFALVWLIMEMFGLTHAKGSYIYLSDGGHFENLGLIELVRRRCRFIVLCDAEEDHNFEFAGLGNAIEKCRTDLGIDIELDVEPIRRRNELGHSHSHCAVGRIRYDQCDPGAHAGTLLYIKSSLTGDEPTDVLRYSARNPAFPHETTNDQWFGESQFESYRALGHHATMSAFEVVDSPDNLSGLTTERLFVELHQRWYPPCSPLDASFKRRGETLKELYETLRTDPDLNFLTQQIYPEWRALMSNLRIAENAPPPPGPWLPESVNEVRAGLYFCNRLIQLMEDVYHDLHLEQEYSHPDNRGWINLFKHWSWSRMFRVTWTVSAANSGARFQSFCDRVLNLRVGEIKVVPPRRRHGELTARDSVLSILQLIEPESAEVASILTPVEKELLRSLRRAYGEFDDKVSLRLIQVVPGGLPNEEGPEFVAGILLLKAGQSDDKPRGDACSFRAG